MNDFFCRQNTQSNFQLTRKKLNDIHRYEQDDVGDENAIEVEFDEEFKRVLFKEYFKIIAKTEEQVSAVCRSCKRILNGQEKSFSQLQEHLRVCK